MANGPNRSSRGGGRGGNRGGRGRVAAASAGNGGDRVTSARSEEQENKEDKNICGYCNLEVTDEEGKGGLMCDLCKHWTHHYCENIPNDEYESWQMCPRAKFYCKIYNCEQKMSNLHDNLSRPSDSTGNGKSMVDILDDKLNSFRMEILLAIETKFKNFATPSVSREEVQDMVRNEVKECVDEHFEREKRKNIVIIYGVEPCPEEITIRNTNGEEVSTKMTPSDKKKYDFEKVQKLKVVHEDLEVKESDVKQIIRLGKSGGLTNQGLPKYAPIRIAFADSDSKWRFLNAAKNLKSATNEWMKRVYVSNDLTQRQRIERDSLRNEISTRRNAGETDLYISKGKIVKRSGTLNDRPSVSGEGHRFR